MTTLIQMFPMEISAYISMHEGNVEYKSFAALKRFVFKYVRTLRPLKSAGPVPLMTGRRHLRLRSQILTSKN